MVLHKIFFPGLLLLALLVVGSGCESMPEQAGLPMATGNKDFQQIDDLILVDCLLPSQVRQLGTRMTYLAPRRRIKTTKSDCGIRGGEFVLFDRSDYGSALQSLLPKARGGDAVAQTYVGEIYEKGLGVSGPDYAEAARWYQQAAATGYRPAQTNLGSLYERGLGVRRDQAAALDWYRQATGVTGDRLMFESELKARQAAFQREISLRNQVAASLRARLARATQASSVAAAVPEQPQVGAAAPPTVFRKAPVAALADPTSTRPESGPRPAELAQLQSLARSLQRDAASEQEQVKKQLHAVSAVQAAGSPAATKMADSGDDGLAAALESALRQQSDALAANQARLAMAP